MPIVDQLAAILWNGVSALHAELSAGGVEEEEDEDDVLAKQRKRQAALTLGFLSADNVAASKLLSKTTTLRRLRRKKSTNVKAGVSNTLVAEVKHDKLDAEVKKFNDEKAHYVETYLNALRAASALPLTDAEVAAATADAAVEFEKQYVEALRREKIREMEASLGRVRRGPSLGEG
eukprot:1292075-Prymnesium_polylepis.1